MCLSTLQLYRQAIPEFKTFLVSAMDRELWRGLRQLQAGESSQQALFPYFAQFVLERYTPEIKAYRWACSTGACILLWRHFSACLQPSIV